MSIKPILFNGQMVKAIIEGQKTVTRRVIDRDISNRFDAEGDGTVIAYIDQETGDSYEPTAICKYKPGDILWVRETWQFIPCIDCQQEPCHCKPVVYENADSVSEGCFVYRADYPEPERICWHPSIHMPKDAARIFLRVIAVRVEQLQKITAQGIRDEGLTSLAVHAGDMEIASAEFELLWDSTIKKSERNRYAWEANPWVSVNGFERCEKPEGWPL